MKTNGLDMVKDTVPYITIGVGQGFMQINATQAIGLVITAVGVFVAYLRFREARRANDIAEAREKRLTNGKD